VIITTRDVTGSFVGAIREWVVNRLTIFPSYYTKIPLNFFDVWPFPKNLLPEVSSGRYRRLLHPDLCTVYMVIIGPSKPIMVFAAQVAVGYSWKEIR
jgi:hypothetical protein